jgi:hypothetical protein
MGGSMQAHMGAEFSMEIRLPHATRLRVNDFR